MSTKVGVIGGSGVQLDGLDSWIVDTPFGPCKLSALDDAKSVLFASRHHCTKIEADSTEAKYAPPHEVNYQALIWALVVQSGCRGGIIALGSTGSLDPENIPVGSVVMADDYYMVRPEAITFWGQKGIGTFAAEDGGEGRIHYTPADTVDETWLSFRQAVQKAVNSVYQKFTEKISLARGQTAESWPCLSSPAPGKTLEDSIVYVNSIGPRFETRAEIRAYRQVGHVVGMTCAREWALCEELAVPYCLVCFCDNACNGLSTHPVGALQEYLDHKGTITNVTSGVIEQLTACFSSSKKQRSE